MWSFWILVFSCLTVSWLIRTCYEEWEYHARADQVRKNRKTFFKAPYWHYWSDGRHFFHVIAIKPQDAIDVLIRESTFAKVMDAEQDYI